VVIKYVVKIVIVRTRLYHRTKNWNANGNARLSFHPFVTGFSGRS